MLQQLKNSAYFWAMMAVMFWSTVATAFKIALDYLTPAELVLYATTSSALALLLVCYYQQKLSKLVVTFRTKPSYFFASALLNPIGYYFILFSAYDLLPGSQAQPINYTWAISLTLLSALFLKQPIRKRDGVACLLGYTGVFIIATHGDLLSFQFDSGLGVLLALISTFIWSAYWILSAKNKSDTTVSLTISFCIATILLWLFLGYQIEFKNLTAVATGAVVYIGLFEMGITFLFWSKAMKLATNTSTIANLIFVSPFVSLMLLHFIRGETIYFSTVVGLAVILLALALQQLPIHRLKLKLLSNKSIDR